VDEVILGFSRDVLDEIIMAKICYLRFVQEGPMTHTKSGENSPAPLSCCTKV
jgi:hypothetical protein